MQNKLKKDGTYLVVDKARRLDRENGGYYGKSILGEMYIVGTKQDCARLRDSIAWYICHTEDYEVLQFVNSFLSIMIRGRRTCHDEH